MILTRKLDMVSLYEMIPRRLYVKIQVPPHTLSQGGFKGFGRTPPPPTFENK